MATLWERTVGGTCYQVRSIGETRRLYTNGVFHSQYNPRRPLTGSVWDLLMLPAFFAPERVRRVLVLGVGGGTVIRQFQYFLAPRSIVGIELDATHLEIARRYFGVGGPEVELIRADAEQWLAGYDGPPFDIVIEDLFGGTVGNPVRAFPADAQWFSQLLRCLARRGTLVMNFPSGAELRGAAPFVDRRIRNRFASAFRLTNSVDENAVGAFLRQPAESAELRNRLKTHPELDPRQAKGVQYHIRRFF